MSENEPMFTVNTDGWIAQQRGRPAWEVVREILQNAMDTECDFSVEINTRASEVVVEDEGPGFDQIEHSWEIFGGDKAADPEKRGRFGRGLKELVGGCEWVKVEDPSGTVTFDVEEGTREVDRSATHEGGTRVTARNDNWGYNEFQEIKSYVKKIWVPDGQQMTVRVVGGNDIEKGRWEPKHTVEMFLPTVVIDESGNMVQEKRRGVVHIMDNEKSGSDGRIYEMGIPVDVECDFPYYVDVQQKVPMAEQRNEPDSSFMSRCLIPELMNVVYEELTQTEMKKDWFTSHVNQFRVNDEVREHFVEEVVKDGRKKDTVYADDPMADDKAENHGYHVFDPGRATDAVGEAVKDVCEPSTSIVEEFKEVYEEKVTPTAAERETIQFFQQIADCVDVVCQIEVWEIEPTQSGDAKIADANPMKQKIRLNRNQRNWGEVNEQNVATIIEELAHFEEEYHGEAFVNRVKEIGAILALSDLR